MWRATNIKKSYAAVLLVAFTISNVFFGFPIDLLINKINESKIVDNLYWAMKDKDVVDRGDVNIPTVVKQALAAQSTIDSAVSTTVTEHLSGSPKTVFISQSTGYSFYVNSGGECSYSKTTDGGSSWGTAVTVDSQTDCTSIAVWYDQWTPGDAGTRIHVATIDVGVDDIWYRSFNTADDTFDNTIFNISDNATYGGTLVVGANYVSITKSTTGALYAATMDASDSIVMRCTATCTTDTNWSENSPTFAVGIDQPILLPQASGAVMLLQWDVSADDLQHKIFSSGSVWDTSWTTIEANAAANTTYDASFGAVIDPSSFEVYLVAADDASTLGTDDDVKVWRYSAGAWGARTDVVSASACAGVSDCGITGAKIAWDETTGYLYVIYTAQSTPGTATTGNVYWKYSTDAGSTWSAEFGPVYSSNDNIYGTNASLKPTSNERIYSTWYAATPDDLFGRPIAPKTFEQAAYRFFANANSTDVGSALAAQDTAATLASTGDAFRLRALLHVGVSDLFTSEGSFKLQFAQKSGTCDTGFSGESYADVTGSTVIAYNNNATPADGDNLTANASDPTHSGHTIFNQDYEEANNFTNTVAVVNTGEDGKWDFALIDNGASASTAYCFRVVKSDGTVLNTYTVIPQITTASASSLTFTVSTNNFPTMTPGSPVFATTTLNVDTNSATGWNVTVIRDDADTTLDLDTDATVNITDQTAWVPGAATTTAGNAVRISSLDSSGDALALRVMTSSGTPAFRASTWWGTTDSYIDNVATLWAGIPSTAKQIGNSSVSCSGANCALNTVLYYLDVSPTQKTGAYSGNITYTATINP